mmetsp:Transcript_24461/g.52964  ORF Transcript_24461/g.52964 Transcript_24461/m.52964 type:complete len:374 (-) Transcript_24461:256-1377(-)
MSKLFKGFFKKGEKGEKEGTANQDTEADHSKAPSEMSLKKETNSIKLGRSDDQHQDLNVLISRPDIVRTISFVKSEQSSRKSLNSVDHAGESGNISLSRSDGGQHCVINVFKGLSDANGASFRLPGPTGDDVNRIMMPHAQSMSSISCPRPDGGLFPPSVRIVHMSDTHNFLTATGNKSFLPNGNILVHSGNFTTYGTKKEFEQFNAWLGSVSQQYPFRIVCFGCRDVKEFGNNWDQMRKLLFNATHVLCHSAATVLGIRFYGAPWHWGHHKNYMVRKGAPGSGRFEDVPMGVQVLITHGAAAGDLDTTLLPGSKELAVAVKRVRPLVRTPIPLLISRRSHALISPYYSISRYTYTGTPKELTASSLTSLDPR